MHTDKEGAQVDLILGMATASAPTSQTPSSTPTDPSASAATPAAAAAPLGAAAAGSGGSLSTPAAAPGPAVAAATAAKNATLCSMSLGSGATANFVACRVVTGELMVPSTIYWNLTAGVGGGSVLSGAMESAQDGWFGFGFAADKSLSLTGADVLILKKWSSSPGSNPEPDRNQFDIV